MNTNSTMTPAAEAKDLRKMREWNERLSTREAEVVTWTRERSQIEATKFVKDYAYETEFCGHDGYYARADMVRDALVNPHYLAAVKTEAPEIFNRAFVEWVQHLHNTKRPEWVQYSLRHEFEGESPNVVRLEASQLLPETAKTAAAGHVDDLFTQPNYIGEKLMWIQIHSESNPVYKAEVERILPGVVALAEKEKGDYLHFTRLQRNTTPNPYQAGKASVNLSHAKDISQPKLQAFKPRM